MARVNTISEGQPLTYEILNQIIQEVNKVKDIPEDFGQNIEIWGPDIKGSSDDNTAKIISGVHKFEIKAKDISINISPAFEKGIFSKDNVVVVASVVDKALGKSGGGAQMANVTITSISKTGFEARVQILKSVKQNVSLELHYIAIGAGPKVTN